MSAYMVSKSHIDALVDLTIYGPLERHRGQQCWVGVYADLGDGRGQRKITDGDEDAFGDVLIRENLSSIHYRYPETAATDPENTPGPTDQYWLAEYRHARPGRQLMAIQGIKAIKCFQYQACEHPEWHDSKAKEILNSMIHSLVAYLEGYDAAAWEIEDNVLA